MHDPWVVSRIQSVESLIDQLGPLCLSHLDNIVDQQRYRSDHKSNDEQDCQDHIDKLEYCELSPISNDRQVHEA
jgi:hypothetical protein